MKYLKKIGNLSVILLLTIGLWKIIEGSCKTIEKKEEIIEKSKGNYLMCNKWIQLKESGKRIGSYLEKNNIKTVALYGLGNIGMNLYDELTKDNIKVLYAIDKNLVKYNSNPPIKKMEDDMEKVDAVIVTLGSSLEEVENELSKKFECPILLLADIIYSI